jgi:cell pole-organizing protein PopZ
MSKGQDLSVEEILNSIRGVVSNHTEKNTRHDDADDILELTEIDHDYDNTDSEELIAENVAEETSEAFKDFADQAEKLNTESSKYKNEKYIESFMVEMLKPEIRKWLNAHLPAIVKQLVEKEIKRLTPK